ncbi:methyltransferase domain-containing protein [Roseomonas sp. SSH11]|uniref:Methyltransferase domain-containing protein n=1 Tax=Pararoseomonas baculiformis TaxID=2820812 RepID=A0ABS4AFV2_9PROT|nr:class I SAM-dependent methyltransferase [Pararoseomonas baculiformis]MBP0445878.1 methyltransferase domain-containing protein [Pararoseomonas baculiformis]
MTPDTPHSVRDAAGRRWPVIDGIVFARASRPELAGEALARLDKGDRDGALVQLLADQDDWWRGPTADEAALRALVRDRAALTLREAMAHLAWGPVGDYFAHRWSDPTFLAGLALMEAHWTAPRSSFELACGIGHYLRALLQRGVACTGADVVFAKLWVARHWVAPAAELVCLDAALAPWPVAEDARFDLVACHDAFYFLEPKGAILARLRRLAGDAGWLAIAHVHNRDWPNLSAGAAVTAEELAALFPDGRVYDDAELTRAALEQRVPQSAPPTALMGAEAFSVAAGPGLLPAQAVTGRLALPPEGVALRRNPLLHEGVIAWPSERYAREYGPRATYPAASDAPERALSGAATAHWALRRELLDLPERW